MKSLTKTLPLFHQSWWLDAVCGRGNWGMAQVHRGDGEILGICPYYLRSFFGFKTVRMPPFTPYLGVWLNEALMPHKRVSRYNVEMRIIRQLVDQLPNVTWYSQVQPPGFDNWLPFYWKRYGVKMKYTYVIHQKSEKKVLEEMNTYTRNRIRKAQKLFTIVTNVSLNDFVEFYNMNMQRHDICISGKARNTLNNLHEKIQDHGCGDIFCVKNEDGQPVAMAYQVWDEQTSYYWLPALDKTLGSCGAAQLLIYHLIILSHAQGKTFNFEGSILPHIEPVFRAFGADRIPIYHIYRGSNRFIYAAKELIGS